MRQKLYIETLPLAEPLQNLMAGGGINLAVSRSSLNTETTAHLRMANNVFGTVEGIGNLTSDSEGIGVAPKITGTVLNAVVRAVIPFPNPTEPTEFLTVKGGRIYKTPINGGAETAVTGVIFNPSSRICFQYALGGVSNERRVYICDEGQNNPYFYNGSVANEEIQFNSPILGIQFPKPSLLPSEHFAYRDRVVYGFGKNTAYRNYILCSAETDGSDFTDQPVTSIADAFFEEVAPADGGYITAIGVLRADNSTDVETLYVFKNNNKSYSSETPKVVANEVVALFGLTANNIGCASAHGCFSMNNEMYALNSYGLGSFTAATQSGNVEAFASLFSQRVNPLFKASSKNSAWPNSFILHSPERNLVISFCPSENSSGNQNGYAYPETPLNQSIQYQYGLTNALGNIADFWSTRQGKGWAFSCGVVAGERIFLGSYFGQVLELFIGNEYERNPAAPTAPVGFESTVETGDMIFNGLSFLKSFSELYFAWQGVGGVKSELCVYFNKAEEANLQDCYSQVGTISGVARWDSPTTGLWDTLGTWAGIQRFNIDFTPSNEGRHIRLKLKWASLEGGVINTAILEGFAGYLTIGKNSRYIR